MTDMLEQWRDPVFNNPYQQVPCQLVSRLVEMAEEIKLDANVAVAQATNRIPRAVGNMPVFPQRIGGLPSNLLIYNERIQALVAVAALARATDLASSQSPGDAKSHVGFVFGRAFGLGCSTADIAIAAGLTPEQVVTIARGTIPAGSSP
jgi:hypothetical protein